MDNLFSFPAASLADPETTAAPDGTLSDAAARELPAHTPVVSQAFEPAAPSPLVREPSRADGDASLPLADAPPAMLHVRLKLLDERVFDVHVGRAAAVAEFRATVEAATAIPPHLQRLIYRGKLLKDGALLSSYDIQDGHMVHLVAKPVASTTSPVAAQAESESEPDDGGERARLHQFIGRSRERLRQTMREEQRDEARAPVSRLRRPGAGDPTGDAWNLAVLREALGQHSDRVPARSSNRAAAPLPPIETLRQGSEQRQMAQHDDAAAAALGPTLVSDAVPNLDFLTQGILTLRTVLSTAALPQDQPPYTTAAMEEAAAEEDEQPQHEAHEEVRARGVAGGDAVAQTPATLAESAAEAAVEMETVTPPRSPARRGRRRFFVGQWLDVKDTVNQWLECTVMDMSDDKVLVHYHGWPSRWDEWIEFDSNRLAAFRTRTPHAASGPHLTPAPSTRLPNAPSVGRSDMRAILPQLRDLMHEVMPFVDHLVALCEQHENEAASTDGDGEDADGDRRRDELSEMAHLVAPFFDRFGRMLVDSARQLDPFLRPELRHDERRRRLQRARAGGSATNRETPTQAQALTTADGPEDTSVSVRDLITTATRPPQEPPAAARRSIDVHIHAIVAPSSLSSLASLARLGTAIAGAMGGSSANSPAFASQQQQRDAAGDLEDAFGLPRLRPLQGGSENRSLLTDTTEPNDDEDARYTDTSRTPLLSSFRRDSSDSGSTSERNNSSRDRDGDASSLLRARRPSTRTSSSSATRLRDFLSDDFFGPSFSQDSDDMDDPTAHPHDRFSPRDRSHDDVVQYQEIPSPHGSSDEEDARESHSTTPRLGVIPEIAEAERRARDSGSSDDADRASSSSSASSSGYPTFLEVMRRTLSGVRNFGFASSSSSQSEDAATATATTQRTTRSESDSPSSSSSSSSSSPEEEEEQEASFARAVDAQRFVFATSALPRGSPLHFRQPSRSSTSSADSIDEDLDSVD